MAKVEKSAIIEKNYITLTRPVVTEKSMMGSQHGQVTFKVPLTATKADVKDAVKALYGVDAVAVNTVLTKGKSKRFKGVLGRRSDSKKAIVTLAEGQTIDLGIGA